MSLKTVLWEHRARNYPLVLFLIMLAVWWYRQEFNEKEIPLVTITGTTFGTVAYNIQYLDAQERDFKPQIDSVLQRFNESLSTYLPESEISRFNRDGLVKFELPYFYPVLAASQEVFDATDGAFDPTVGPLIDAWGFGPERPIYPDSSTVDSLLAYVSFDSLYYNEESLCRLQEGLELSFSAIAKGQGVDVVAQYIMDQGVDNLFVEIGGEVKAEGHFIQDRPWVIGIEDPLADVQNRRSVLRVKLEGRGVATSGNYRNFYTYEGRKYAHTLDPTTGYPVTHSLLSATVFADDCMLADAYATAFMVLGVERTQALLAEHEELDAILIYDTGKEHVEMYFTEGIKQAILN